MYGPGDKFHSSSPESNVYSRASLKLLIASLDFLPSLFECESLERCAEGSRTHLDWEKNSRLAVRSFKLAPDY